MGCPYHDSCRLSVDTKYVCNCLQKHSQFVSNTSRIQFVPENLPVFAHCTVAVRCKQNYIDKTLGFWSERRVRTFRSQEGGLI